jgi:hypothetical protein
MPQTMERDVRHSDLLHARRPFLTECVGVANCPIPIGKDESIIGRFALPKPETEFLLRLPVGA